MRWAGHAARMRGSRGVYSVLVGHPEGEKQVERHCGRWYNLKCMLKESVGREWARFFWLRIGIGGGFS